MTTISAVPARLAAVREAIHAEFTRPHTNPWIVAYSGGKDSTLLLQLVWEIAAAIPIAQPRRRIYIVSNDTLVESPLVIRHLHRSLDLIRVALRQTELPITIKVTKPCIDQTFWVNVIGRGYIPPTRNFRWCTDRMKIAPTNDLIQKLVLAHQRAILLVGTRRSESQNRGRAMAQRRVTPTTMNPHSTIPHCRMFAPLADLCDDDVWKILIQRRPPWGGTHRDLITLYRNAGGGECPLVLTPDDAPSCGTNSPRFGCWTCTVVTKDRSMRGVIDSGHEDATPLERLFDFREWLIVLREDTANRQRVRRDGNPKTRIDGSRVFGPFTLDVREQILKQLRILVVSHVSTLGLSGSWSRAETAFMPQKKYIVRLTDEEREICRKTVRKLKASSEKVRRAQILLKADADGPGWTDQQIADALSCRTKTVENVRQRCVQEGFERALERKRRPLPPGLKRLDGEQEAQVIALRLGTPPKGYASWSLRLLARRVVELAIVGSVSHETIRRTLKKTG